MKSKRLKKLIAVAMVSTMVTTALPITAYADWLKDSQSNWSFIEEGNKVTGWKQIDGTWYHFDVNGKMQTGWIQTQDSKWYYMNADGGMKTGWLRDKNEKWYYLESSGEMKIGWLKDTDGKWYYLASGGEMKTGWIQDVDGKWYFTDISGAMQTGTIEVQGKIYVFQASGAMATGSVVNGGVTYTLDPSGAIIGNKLPTPEKAFTNEGRTKGSNITENKKTETTQKTSSSSSSSNSSNNNSSNDNSSNIVNGQDLSCNATGSYGPSSGTVDVKDVSVNAQGVTLKNMHIKGDLVLGEGIGEGDVYLENVTVDGTTIVKGGGENSIHFINSILATVIVNKNDGRIRLVVEGRTQVANVQLESPARLEESGLTGGSTGFDDITVTDNVQTGANLQVELVGLFHNVNSRASHVRIQLSAGTYVQTLVLNAATTVLGTGRINTARINADGTSMSSRPENMVIHYGFTVILQEESGNTTIFDSYSNSTSAEITAIELNMNSIKVNMSNFVSDLALEDFTVSAKLDGQDYVLQDLDYDANTQRFTFEPVPLEGNIGKELEVTITSASDKVIGEAQSDEVTVQNGFTGRITDVQEVGISGVTINFRAGEDSSDGEVVATAETDEDGYYTVYLAPGEYTGEISGTGIVTTYMYASSSQYEFNREQDATAIRATGMDSVKIVLTWGERPYDEDSHLEGPTAEGGRFHTWYGNKIYQGEDGIRYADLDWDDITSYGPETTTIYRLVDGKYRFYVHNYSGYPSLASSSAKVQVYKGNSTTPINTFEIPDDTRNQNALYWFVFDMNVSGNGKTVDITPLNELRYDTNSTLRLANSAEESYVVNYGVIQGVPAGTVGDLKADLSVYDGGALKVCAAGTYISDEPSFDAAIELSNSTTLTNGQIVAIKAQDGTIAVYTISIFGTDEIAPVITSESDPYVTTSSAATWTPIATATDNVDGDITEDIITTYSSDDYDSDVTDLTSARTHLGTAGNRVTVSYDVSDAAGNPATPVSVIFTAVEDVTTSAGAVVIIDDNTDTITVPSETTLEDFKTAATTSAGVTFEVYEADETTEATDLQSGYKLIFKAEDGTIIKVYTIRKEDLI